ncbi:MAG TPA: PPK2 family polyphosphate kinase [Mycobacteriales bacterium]|nr:PPK2 family polyphosphate kinase [Mycobacteriales bacterium]
MATSLRDALRVAPGEPVDLDRLDARATPLAPGGKKKSAAAMVSDGDELADLQEKLFAAASRRVLVVLQGMDTSGKGGVIDHVIGLVNPQGVHITSFKKPTEEELRHHFLWRVRRALPAPGLIGIFDRSHYEDVLIARVHGLAQPEIVEKRYGEIVRFEKQLADQGYALVKCFLHVSYDQQRERLLARLDDPTKHWKFNPGDLAERARWADYQEAYRIALERCSTDAAPWYAVPADRKWYRNWAIGRLLLETVRDLDPQYPQPALDIPALRKALKPPN